MGDVMKPVFHNQDCTTSLKWLYYTVTTSIEIEET
jgi:hypothetical protein